MPDPSRPTASQPPAHFERLYERADDPWGYATSAYEREKYAATLAALPRARYGSALEIGCSIGVLTAQLAARCDHLLAIDYAENALARARERCAGRVGVEFRRLAIPGEYPAGRFDLVILSEVGYYLSREDLRAARAKIVGSLAPGGQLLLIHWTPPIDDAPLNGDDVHQEFLDGGGDILHHLLGQRAATYRLDLLERRGAVPAAPEPGA